MGDNRLPVRDTSVIGWKVPVDVNLETQITQAFAKLGGENAIDHASTT